MGRKQLYGHFKRQTSEISHEKTWKYLRKGNLKRETKSILIAVQNNAIKTNYVKEKIYMSQQNSRCRLCGDRDEIINHIVSECSQRKKKTKKTKKTNIKHDLMGKVIHWEL